MKQLTLFRLTIALLLFVAITSSSELLAQSGKSTENLQKVILKKADLDYKKLNYSTASSYYEEYMQISNSENKNVLLKLADSYWRIGKYDAVFSIYKQLFPTATTKVTKQLQLRIAELYARFNDYERAAKWLRGIEGYKARADAFSSVSELDSMKKDSLSWNIELLDLNTIYQEFSPCLSDSILYFSGNRSDGSQKKSKEEEVVLNYTRLWKVPVKDVNSSTSIGKAFYKINTKVTLVDGFKNIRYNTAPVSIDKNKHFYFSINYHKSDKSGVKLLCLMEAFYTAKGYLKTSIIHFSNPKAYTVMHPAINTGGTLIVLSSNKPDGVGGYDLYYAERKSINKPWSELKPLGHNVNTIGDDVFPTITSNGDLYYSSDATPGLGGLDIFRIPLKDAMSGTGSSEHLSYPINSSSDDFGWAQGTDSTGYFTSDRLGSNDIYSYSYSSKKTEKSIVLNKNGKVVKSNRAILATQAAMLSLNSSSVGDIVERTDLNKSYILSALPPSIPGNWIELPAQSTSTKSVNGKIESLSANRSDVLLGDEDNTKDSVNLINTTIQNKLTQLKSRNKVENVRPNFDTKYMFTILFNSNRSDITPSSYYLLNALVHVMKKYPCLILQIKSHTDIDGGDEFNLNLSKDRAINTRNYLIKEGIERSRLDILYLGKTQLLNENKNAVEKALNRRVSFLSVSPGCKLNVDSLLSVELLVNHEKDYSKKIYVLKDKDKFVVQVGIFKSKAMASATVAKLQRILPENIYVVEETDSYKVRVGYSKSLIEAEKMAAIIEAIGILD